ncbi:MAG: peptide-methionine (S)-S-oxide reductase MsrA [Planctomycetes bacterium]|nr:peptide-methionine (S)-S-oxide reductase MsrA [Planctomycetota bacterium]
MLHRTAIPFLISAVLLAACASCGPNPTRSPMPDLSTDDAPPTTSTATFGAGCYWCVEAVLEQVDGILEVDAGFMGGHVEDPSYEQVCSGTTGHTEVVQLVFDPSVISYDQILEWFWKLHDPTTLDRQGADVGPMYRSVIFYRDEDQRRRAEDSKARAEASGHFDAPIVTAIESATTFYRAKQEHQDFYRNNRSYGYCRAVIAPKLDKLGLEK